MLRLGAVLSLAGILLLSGCGNGIGSNTQSVAVLPVTGLHGIVHGGNQPVTSAAITLMAVGTTGYGSTGTVLATTSTDTNGNFAFATGAYTCPASDPYVYITSTGGDPGLIPTTINNTAISLVAALTDCNTLKTNAATTFISINEVTTVAAAYALSQFINPSTGAIGSYSSTSPYSANIGLNNAFLTAANLANTSTGAAYSVTPGNNGVVPQSEINTLANILSYCVNTSSNSSSGCTTLFGDLAATNTIAPTNTLLAALSMARHPGYNVSTIWGLAGANTPFQPALPGQPNDWTVALAFNDSAVSPRGIAIDSNGYVWIAAFNTGGTSSSLNKINPQGVLQNFITTNVNGILSLAVSDTNNIWVSNSNNTLMQYANTGNSVSGPFTGLDDPVAMALDPFGNLWIANNTNNTVAEFNTSAQSFISSGYSGGGLTTPFTITTDTSGNAWVGNAATVTKLNNLGVPSSGSPISSGGISSPGGITIDGSNNVWITNFPSGSDVAELNNSGSALSGSGYTGSGIAPAHGIAIDGGGSVWIAEQGQNRLTVLTAGGVQVTPATGYQGGNLNAPKAIAIDGSGNIWVANVNSTTTGTITTTISEFVGTAVPVITPQVVALEVGQVATPPGTPIPVSIAGNAVPYYTPGNGYDAQLYASGGNSNSYTWSVTAGGLPTPITLSSSGLISGTTSLVGSYTFTAQACDSQNASNCATQSITLSANTAIPARGNESVLTGAYAVQVEGFRNGSSVGITYGSDFVASLSFNGTGGVTGEIDTNDYKTAAGTNGTVTGYYAYGADNRGTIYLIPAASGVKPYELAFVGDNLSGSTPQTLRLILFEDTVPGTGSNSLATGAGIGKLQNGTPTFNGTYVFGMQGETPCTSDGGVNAGCATITPFGPLTAAGEFTANGSLSITSGEEDTAGVNATFGGTALGPITMAGSYTAPDASGRGTLTLNLTAPSGGSLYPAAPTHFVYYAVSPSEMYVMSTDGHTTNSMLSGDVLLQSGTFSNTTISGNYLFSQVGGQNGDGVVNYPTESSVGIDLVTIGSGSTLSLIQDSNNGQGQVKTELSQGPFSYSIDSKGRMTLGNGQPIFYLANGTQAFGEEQPSATNTQNPDLLTGQQQTSGGFGCPSSTTFALGTAETPLRVSGVSGVINTGTGVFTEEYSDPYGVLLYDNTGTIACTTDSLTATTGRVVFTTSFGTSDAAYPINAASKWVVVDIVPSDSTPNIFTLEK